MKEDKAPMATPNFINVFNDSTKPIIISRKRGNIEVIQAKKTERLRYEIAMKLMKENPCLKNMDEKTKKADKE